MPLEKPRRLCLAALAKRPCMALGSCAVHWKGNVLSRHARADRAENFVWNRLLPRGQIGGGDALLSLLSDEDGLMSDVYARHVGHIDHDHVHADPPDDRSSSPSDEHHSAVRQ